MIGAEARRSYLSYLSDQWPRRISYAFSAFMRKIASKGSRSAGNTGDSAPPTDHGVKCIFCLHDDPELNRIMCENMSFFARHDNFPATIGHLEIVPKRHIESFFDLTDAEIGEAYALLREAQRMLAEKYEPHGYTIGINEGRAAGRSVDHLHIHLIPRYHGDVKDPRGGIRQAAPNCDPDSWVTGD